VPRARQAPREWLQSVLPPNAPARPPGKLHCGNLRGLQEGRIPLPNAHSLAGQVAAAVDSAVEVQRSDDAGCEFEGEGEDGLDRLVQDRLQTVGACLLLNLVAPLLQP
jgi:hypothetical protein